MVVVNGRVAVKPFPCIGELRSGLLYLCAGCLGVNNCLGLLFRFRMFFLAWNERVIKITPLKQKGYSLCRQGKLYTPLAMNNIKICKVSVSELLSRYRFLSYTRSASGLRKKRPSESQNVHVISYTVVRFHNLQFWACSKKTAESDS